MDNIFYWCVTSCSLVEIHRRFGGAHCLYLQGQKINQTTSKEHSELSETSVNFRMQYFEQAQL
jgi:hypothetical protein